MTTIATRMKELGITLPSLTAPSGTYVPFRMSGSTIYISGQVPRIDGTDQYLGVVGETIQIQEAYQAARVCALNILARLSTALNGDLDRVSACLQVRGFVNAAPTFKDHPAVIDGASDLFVEVFGEIGRHSRTALGAGSLPRGFAVEVDAIFEARS